MVALSAAVLALSWAWTADLGVFKPQLERIVAEKTGRNFLIEGNFQVDLAATTVLVAEDVKFANADWAEEPQMVSIGRIELHIDLWSLVNRPIQVVMVDLDDADVYLTAREDGDPNWTLPIEPAPDSEVNDEGSFSPREIVFDRVDVNRVHVVYTDPARTSPVNLDIASFHQRLRDNDFQDFRLNATLNEKVLELVGEAGTWEAIVSGADIRFDARLILDTLTVTASGHLDDITNLRRPTLEFAATGPDIDDLTRVLGLGEEGTGDIDLEGRLAASSDDSLELSLVGNLGSTDIETRGVFPDLQNFDSIDFDVQASGPDIGRLLQLAGIHNVRESPFMIDINATRDGESFRVNRASMQFGEAQFQGSANLPSFPSVDDASIDMRIFGPDIERFRYIFDLPGAATGAFSAAFELDVTPDGLEVAALEATTSLGTLRASAASAKHQTTSAQRRVSRFNLTAWRTCLSAYGVENLPAYPVSLTGAIELLDDRVRTTQPLVVQLDVIEVTLTAAGDVVLASGAVGSDLALTAAGTDISELIRLLPRRRVYLRKPTISRRAC